MTSNIKVVDIEEGEKEVNEAVETIPEEANIENAVEQTEEAVNEILPAEPKTETKKEAPVAQSTRAGLLNNPPVPVEQTVKQNIRQQDKLVKCPKCDKQMKLKSYRYKHELSCKGKLEDIPKKPKAMPKPKAQPIIQEVQEVEQPKLTAPVSNQILKPQPRNPLSDITNHYQILHQQYIQQKKEKYDALCKNMFSTKMKKR